MSHFSAEHLRFRWPSVLLLGALVTITFSGCGRLRLPAIDPYGNRIFLPAPNYTTVAPRPRYSGLIPEPAFQAPVLPPPCPPVTPVPPVPKSNSSVFIDDEGVWPWEFNCLPFSGRWWRGPNCEYDFWCNPCADRCSPEDHPVYDLSRYDEPSCYEPKFCYGAMAPYPGYVKPMPATTAVPPNGPQSYTPAASLGAPGQDTRAARHQMHDAEMRLNPRRLVMSVGREAVLRAGLCDEEGFLLNGQPIEWSLSQESVGTIVEVDSTSRPFLRRLFDVQPEKKSSNFAVGRTSTKPQVLARGTVDPRDDIWLLEGQTWISVSSQSEGVTHVTAMAPSIAGWQERMATATIHWIDGQWTFPPPAINGPTSGQVITTRLLRASTGMPIEGWRVRYEITGGAPATLDIDGRQVQTLDVKSDSDGNANALVVPQRGHGGTTTLKIQVVRIGTASTDLSNLVVGEGATSVTWTTPNLVVAITGPQFAQVGSQVMYQLNVTNTGAAVADNVELIDNIPTGLEYLKCTPAWEIFGDRIKWSLGSIGPGKTAQVTLDFRVTSGGMITNCAEALTVGGVKVSDCTSMQIAEQTISIDVDGPQTAVVGQPFQYRITITNRGTQPVPEVLLLDRFDDLLTHKTAANYVERPVGIMQPGQQEFVAITLTPKGPGTACNLVEARSAGSVVANSRNCVEISDGIGSSSQSGPPPGAQLLTVTMRGDETVVVGERVLYSSDINNNTGTDLSNVQVTYQFDDQLKVEKATQTIETGAITRRGSEFRWLIASFPRGRTLTIEALCQGIEEGRACGQIIVSAPGGQESRDQVCTDVIESDKVIPLQSGLRQEERPGSFDMNDIESSFPPGLRQAFRIPDRLEVSVVRTGRLVKRPGQAVYMVTLHNPRETPASNVVLKIGLPRGLAFADSVNPPHTNVVHSGDGGRSIEYSPILDLRAGESVQFQIFALGEASLESIVASVNCDELSEPIVGQEPG